MKQIRQVFANRGIQQEYQRRLDRLIESMYLSVAYWLSIGLNPRQIANEIKKRTKAWEKIFGKQAKKIAKWFVDNTKRYAEIGMENAFLEQGYRIRPKVSYKKEQAVLIENEDLIESIPTKFFAGIAILAMMALQYDQEIDLTTEIKKRYDMTKRRAKVISEDQNHKANQIFKLSICENLGITKGKWVYTYRSKEPRLSHIRANGKIFDLSKGLKVDGEYILPAEKINCKCDFVPVITEFDE